MGGKAPGTREVHEVPEVLQEQTPACWVPAGPQTAVQVHEGPRPTALSRGLARSRCPQLEALLTTGWRYSQPGMPQVPREAEGRLLRARLQADT